LRITRDSRYGDSMERVLYNTVLGAKPIQPDGKSFYYSDYHTPGQKVYYKDKWPCCSGTLPQVVADYRISAYFRGPLGVFVNLYVPSTLRWQENGAACSLEQATDYPYEGHIRMKLTAAQPREFSVFLRIPEWAKDARVSVNGMRGDWSAMPASFVEIRRSWKTGDRIELELPLPVRLEAVDAQHPNEVALVRGPLVLMALTNPPAALNRKELLTVEPKGHLWSVKTGTGEVLFKAFRNIGDEQYRTYLSVA
jgi:DUF1680 family protein